MTIKPLSLNALKTVPLASRKADSDEEDFGAPYQAGSSFSDFLCSLPNLGAGSDLFLLRDAIISARRHNRPVILGCGGHVMDSGLGPLIVRLIEQRIVTGLAFTGSALLQDVEIALSGHTVRYRDKELQDGRFCITEETGLLINEAINFGSGEGWGIGKSVGQKLIDLEPEHLDHSVLAAAERYGIPVTVHPAIGADAFNLHPACHGESLGATGQLDFRLLGGMLGEASGGVLINAASSVLLPHVFLHAVDAARNVGKQVENLTCAVIDPAANADTIANIVSRLSQPGGQGFWLPGPDEILVPLLFASVIDAFGDELA